MPQLPHIRRFVLAFCVSALVLAVSAVTHADDIKQIHPTGYVTDLAGIIRPETKTQLEALCYELEQKTGAQLAIVTVKSLDGQEVQPYANDLFKQLAVGQKKLDNGVMLLVAPNDRKYWTEVGYGLEPIINDARAGDAGRLMVAYFRQGNYSAGVLAAAQQLAKYVADAKGVTLTGVPQIRRVTRSPSHHSGIPFWLLLIAFVLILRAIARSGGGRPSGGGGPGFGTGLLVGSILDSMARGSRGGWSSGGGGSGGGGWGGSGGGFGGFGGGSSGGGGAGGSW